MIHRARAGHDLDSQELPMPLDRSWFTEICEPQASALSLRVTSQLHEEQSAQHRIEVYASEQFGRILVVDGRITLSERFQFIYQEMMSHPALYSHAAPARVAILGGAGCGTLYEVLKHPQVRTAVQVTADERIASVAAEFFPSLCDREDETRAAIVPGPPLSWLEAAPDRSLDVLIVDDRAPADAPDAAEQVSLYSEARRVLASEGLLVLQSGSPLYDARTTLRPQYDALRAAGYLDMLAFGFPHCLWPSGWWSATVACTDLPVTFAREPAAEEEPVQTRYYNSAIHRTASATPNYLAQVLLG
jgi:spermidine synthase